jgi:hypothetical protein
LIVINSASDETLVADFGKEFGLTEVIGSNSQNVNFGMKKIQNLIDKYPRSDFIYCTGISDNLEDTIWARFFENFICYEFESDLESNRDNLCF